MTSGATLKYTASSTSGTIDLRNAIAEFGSNAEICYEDAPLYVMEVEEDGSLTGQVISGTLSRNGGMLTITNPTIGPDAITGDKVVMVDYYVDLPGKHVYEADITPETFGGNYYVEADTLFRDQHTGKDLPANLTFPNVRLQSNFTMTFAGTGDPSTFDFTMDAFPDYTYFDRTKKVLAVMQIVDSIKLGAGEAAAQAENPVMYHDNVIEEPSAGAHDSYKSNEEQGSNVTIFEWNNGESGSRAYNIPNVGDGINFGNFVRIAEGQKEMSLSDYAPDWSTSDEDGAYLEISADGYILAKAQPATPSSTFGVSCKLPKFSNGSGNDPGKTLTLEITIGPQAAG